MLALLGMAAAALYVLGPQFPKLWRWGAELRARWGRAEHVHMLGGLRAWGVAAGRLRTKAARSTGCVQTPPADAVPRSLVSWRVCHTLAASNAGVLPAAPTARHIPVQVPARHV